MHAPAQTRARMRPRTITGTAKHLDCARRATPIGRARPPAPTLSMAASLPPDIATRLPGGSDEDILLKNRIPLDSIRNDDEVSWPPKGKSVMD